MEERHGEIVLINVEENETQIAVVEGNILEEFYVEHEGQEGIVGNIYKGRVSSVLPGMNAAFVDIGVGRNGFLYADEVRKGDSSAEEAKNIRPKIDSLLKKGEDILVQVEKEPYGTKGPRLTTQVTIPGRKLVFMPYGSERGISRRIEDTAERERLKGILSQMKLPQGTGIIIRTQGSGYSKRDFEYEMRYLLDAWRNIANRMKRAAAPTLLYKEAGLIMRVVRDIVGEKTHKAVINSKDEFKKIYQFLRSVQPNLKSKLELYKEDGRLFEKYGIERQIERLYDRKVHLKSGGYITIEQTEGLVAIDVNTGKFTGRRALEETVTKTNLEAAREIARQLRLRDISGIIVIDFIDMERSDHRRHVELELETQLRRDKAKTEVFGMSPLGIIEMTRQRVRRGIEMTHQEVCPYCGGRGTVKSKELLCLQAMRKLKRYSLEHAKKELELALEPSVADYMLNEKRDALASFEQENKIKVLVIHDDILSLEQMTIRPARLLSGGQARK